MDKLKLMKTFMLVVEEGSIARAALKLGITKAAASKHLIELESSLNTQLLQRSTRRLNITDTGQLFYDSLNNVFSAVNDAESAVTHLHEKPAGTLRIGSHRYFGEQFIINHLHEFVTIYPNLKLDIELADRFPDMEKENFDVLCGIGHDGPDHLVRKKIGEVRYILCASPAYISRVGKLALPEDLKKLRYITHSFRTNDNIFVFKNKKEVYIDFDIRLNDAQAMLKCALQGLGFIKIYNHFVEEYIKKGDLIEIFPEYKDQLQSIYIFYKQQKFVSTKIRVFIDFLCRKLKAGSNAYFKY